MVMIDDDHFETQTDVGPVATEKDPKKGRSGQLSDATCIDDVRLVTAVNLRRSEEYALISSIRRIVRHLDSCPKKRSVVFYDRCYSSFAVVDALKKEGVFMFGTAHENDLTAHVHVPIAFNDNKDEQQKNYAAMCNSHRMVTLTILYDDTSI